MIQRSYTLNDSALDTITEDWQAYFLGLMASDGSMNKNGNTIKIKLHHKDKEILEILSKKFELDKPLYKDGNALVLFFASAKIKIILESLGLVPGKTYLPMHLPPISSDLIPAYIRGYFDGDGSVSWRAARPGNIQLNICSVNQTFLIELQAWLAQANIKSSLNKELRLGKELKVPSQTELSTTCLDMYRLFICSYEDRLKFFNLCWSDNSICIERKKKILVDYFKLQEPIKKNKSRKYPWVEIYNRYRAGEKVPTLAQEYGFYWRSFYLHIERNNLECNRAPIASDCNTQTPNMLETP